MATGNNDLREWVRAEPVQAVLATAFYARMQAASYQVLKTVAAAAGQNAIARSCEECRLEQLDFADWLDQQIPQILMSVAPSPVGMTDQQAIDPA